MQAGSYLHWEEQEALLEWSCGYFALHVGVAHFAPSSGEAGNQGAVIFLQLCPSGRPYSRPVRVQTID